MGVGGGLPRRGGNTGVGRVYSVGLTRVANPWEMRSRDARNNTRKDREKEAIFSVGVFNIWILVMFYSGFLRGH